MTDNPCTRPDLRPRLRAASQGIDDLPAREVKDSLAEAIKTLRQLVGIRGEVWLEDAKPEGKA